MPSEALIHRIRGRAAGGGLPHPDRTRRQQRPGEVRQRHVRGVAHYREPAPEAVLRLVRSGFASTGIGRRGSLIH